MKRDSCLNRSARGLSTVALLTLALGALAAEREPARAPGEPGLPEREWRERQDLKAQLEQKRVELKALREAPKGDEAEKLKGEVAELERRVGALPGREPASKTEEKLRQMGAEIEELRRAGRLEDAERLERQRAELKERWLGERQPLAEGWRPGAEGRAGFEPGPDLERRQQHMRVAIMNLHAAGLHDLAERVGREAEAELRRPDLNAPGAPRPGALPPGMAAERLERLESEVRELRQAVRELRGRLGEPGNLPRKEMRER